jgi:antitoxin (DNA-binding transcriptional repressor) of toxin-antitoxin stability system
MAGRPRPGVSLSERSQRGTIPRSRSSALFLAVSGFGPCDAKMDRMRRATVRDLRYRFPEIETLLQEGQEIQITKRKRVIARLVPERQTAAPRLPDFVNMLKEIYGDRKLKVTGAQMIRAERDEGY